MNRLYDDVRNRERGLSTLAVVVIAAVVIGGGAILVSSTNDDGANNDNATTTAEMEADAYSAGDTAVFTCDDGSEIVADFAQDGEATVTLPSGEARSVTRTEATSSTRYVTADGAFTFWSEGQEATVEQEGEVLFEGCAATEDSTEAEGDAEAEADTDAEADADASTNVEAEAGVNVDADVEGGASAQ